MQLTSRTARTLGFTLMEVLISIGVAAIGILGVLTLLPLAQHQAFQGLLEDRKTQTGHAALRTFRIAECARTQRWVVNTGSGDTPSWAPAAAYGPLPQGTAYCIDPLMLNATPDPTFISSPSTRLGRLQAQRPLVQVGLNGATSTITATAFPNSTTMPANLLMPRVTLAGGYAYGTGNALPVMGLQMAETLCLEHDDLATHIPEDKTQLPQQMDVNGSLWPTVDPTGTQNAPATGTPTRRQVGGITAKGAQTGGLYSWFATVVPVQGSDLDLYTVSIAVCYNRRFDLVVHPEGERALLINFLSPNEIQLSGPTAASVDFRPGQWILISAQPGSGMPIHKWYRLVQVEGEPQSSGPSSFLRTVTIHGPDWQAAWGTSAQATVVDTVVGVYEKLLRLETSSLWISQ